MNRIHSQQEWLVRAHQVLPAGGFGHFDPGIVIARGKGARVWDEEGRSYVDQLIGSGPMIAGHAHPEVMEAVFEQLSRGQTFFANNTRGIELAEEIVRAVRCAEQVRFLSSGSEADMYAIRLARAVTGRDRIVKFEGGFHGMSAEALMSLEPEHLSNFPMAVADSAGIPSSVRADMLIAPFNDAAFVRSLVEEQEGNIAAIMVEPMQRVIPPEPGFLRELRDICTAHGILLIFDEIVTGFRLAYGGAQELHDVTPDIVTLGKIIGGGFPLSAIAAPADIMKHFDRELVGKERWLIQRGTLSGNPVASAAGLKTMEILRREGQYERLRKFGRTIQELITGHLNRYEVPHRIVGDLTLFEVAFTDRHVRDYRDWLSIDAGKSARFNQVLRENGILKSPGKLYVCLALAEEDIAQTDAAFAAAARAVA